MGMTTCTICGTEYNEHRPEDHCCECEQLRAENAELKRDAERWRTYLKVFAEEGIVEAQWEGPEAITAYIDAAMKGGK